MKAAFTLVPAESKRLIAKAVVQMDEVRSALEKAYVVLTPGTTVAYIVQELLGMTDIEPQRRAVGTNSHRLLCITENAADPASVQVVLERGRVSTKTVPEVLNDFHLETVIVKGANAVDAEGNVGVVLSGFDGGSVGKTIGTVVSQGLRYIVAVGLEKMVPSVKEAAAWSGAKTLGYSLGAEFGIMLLPNAIVVTEIEALKILADVEAKHVASGGVGDSAGSVVLVIQGEEEKVRKAISIVESIKGEPVPPGFKGNCEKCRYACKFVGAKLEDLPPWLRD